MKNIVILLSILGFISCKNNMAVKDENKKADITNLVNAEIDVKGMTCTGCENSINNSVNSVKGVSESKSSHTEGKTWVKFDTAKTDINTILSAIKETGYEVEGFNMISTDTIH